MNKSLENLESEVSRKVKVLANTTDPTKIKQLNKEIDALNVKIKAMRGK